MLSTRQGQASLKKVSPTASGNVIIAKINLQSRVVLQVSEVPGRQKTELCLLFRARIHRRHMHHGKPRQNHTFWVCCLMLFVVQKWIKCQFYSLPEPSLSCQAFFSWASQLASHPNRNNQNIHPHQFPTSTWSDNWRTCAGNIWWSQQISCSPFCLPSWQDLLSCSSGLLAFTGKQNDDRNPSPLTMNPESFPL